MSINFTDSVDLLTGESPESSDGVSITTTGTGYDVSKRQQIVVQFTSDDATGSGAFTLDGSNDGSTWTTGLACQDLTSATSTTFVTSKTLNSASSAAVKVPSGWRFIRAVCTVTTGGTYRAFMEAGG